MQLKSGSVLCYHCRQYSGGFEKLGVGATSFTFTEVGEYQQRLDIKLSLLMCNGQNHIHWWRCRVKLNTSKGLTYKKERRGHNFLKMLYILISEQFL